MRDADGRLQYEYGSEDDNGYANRPSAQGFNSKAELYNNKAYYTRNSLSARSYITFGTVREEARLYGLKLTMNFGTDYTDYQRTLVYDKEHGNAAQQGGRLSKTNTRTLSYTFNQLLTYDRTFGDHSLNLLAGHEYYRYKYNYALGEKTGIVGGIDELGPAVTTTAIRTTTAWSPTSRASTTASRAVTTSTPAGERTVRRASIPATAGAISGRWAPRGASPKSSSWRTPASGSTTSR